MADRTMLVMPGRKLSVPVVLKRTLQVAMAVALTAAVALALVVGSGWLLGRSASFHGFAAWLAFIKRPDIQATAVLTAAVTVLFVYWQRDHERK
jgi:hypothetical protein